MSRFCDEAFVDSSGSAVGQLGSGPLRLYVLGHIDTVPGEIPMRVEDGKLYGRGSVDAKGPFCAAIAAASRLPEKVSAGLTLRLIGATEEEAPSSRGARHALEAYAQPDALIIGEPSGWDAVTLGYKGRLVAKLRVERPHFHSAGEGVTAAEELVNLWNALRAEAETFNANIEGVFGALQISLQEVSSHNDGLRQRAEATVGYRLPPALTPEEVMASVRARLEGRAEVEFTGAERAYRGGKDTFLARAFRVAIRAGGGRPRQKVKTGTSDMNVVAPHWNVPMLAYGPGDSALDHTPNEHLSLAEFEGAVEVLERVFAQLARAHEGEVG